MNPPAPERVQSATRRASQPRTSPLPAVSVVVASNRPTPLLQSCLGSLVPQCAALGAELIVARACTAADAMSLAHAYPTVTLVNAPAGASIPQLRGAGMARASGDVVALTEDHCVADPQWLQTLVRGTAGGADIVGGGIDNAQRTRAVDWAAYFAEYGFFATNRPPGHQAPPLLTGANVAYRREIVGEVIEWACSGEWENVVHARLHARGSDLQFVGSAAISQNRSYAMWDFCVDRYEHGRDYARKRLAEEEASRWALFAATPALPFVLTSRVARAAARTRMLPFVRALPVTFAFLTAWSVGEAVGYMLGPAPVRERS